MKFKPLHLALGAAVLGVGYMLLHKTARFIGDKALVGDDAYVPLASVASPELQAAMRLFPAGGFVDLKVSSVTPETLNGTVVAYVVHQLPTPQVVPLTIPIGPISVARSNVSSVSRGGREVT
jgi:hypothetical protein